jgi:hypothetical protein
VDSFPPGVDGPKKVRIYRRRDHFVLQWWDPAARANLSDRIDGDLVAALVRAREVDTRIRHFKSAGGGGTKRLSHAGLVEAFQTDLIARADAGEIDPGTVARYRSALDHYLTYATQPRIEKQCKFVAGVNREFRMGFEAYLAARIVTPNGRGGKGGRPMRSAEYVLQTTGAMFEWAADPDRGNLVPAGFRNPFLRTGRRWDRLAFDPLAPPDITIPMAGEFLAACDRYQLRLFAPILLFGLRAAEPCFLFTEHLSTVWLSVPNIPDLNYQTKGGRGKSFPLIACLNPLWSLLRDNPYGGMVYHQRDAGAIARYPLLGVELHDLVTEYRRRVQATKAGSATERRTVRDEVLRAAGGLRYDDVEQEFGAVARTLDWPRTATLKDFRHLFATTLHNARIGESYRQYLMGHSRGRAAILSYTHLDQLRIQYESALAEQWPDLLSAIAEKVDPVPSS